MSVLVDARRCACGLAGCPVADAAAEARGGDGGVREKLAADMIIKSPQAAMASFEKSWRRE